MQYNAAQDQYFNSVQHYGSMNDCNSYAGGGCYNYHGSWVPAFTGFVAGALIGHSLSNWHYSYHAPYYRRTPPAYVQHTTIVHNYGNSGSTYNTRSNYAAPTTPARPYVSTYGGANAPSSYVNSKYSPSTRTATPAFSAPKTTTSFSAPRTSTSAFSTSRKPTRIH